jgi:tetratricopeptide (TPR) repeat protein
VYVAHNEHMLAYAAMMTGRSELAISHIRAMVAGLSPEFLQDFGSGGEAFLAMPLEVLVRFGRWDEVLAEPEHPAAEPFTHAFQHAARGVALAAKGDTAAARKEQALYLEAVKAVTPDWTAGNNSCQTIFTVVTPMLEGEILVREGQLEAGVASLRAAMKAEDALRYDEPPGWLIPLRHSLGAVLMRAGRYAEAEQVYRDDLARVPGNGWSLFGLGEALTLQHRAAEAAVVQAQFKKAWSHADLTITSSCLCQVSL